AGAGCCWAFEPRGRTFASGSWAEEGEGAQPALKLWNAATGDLQRTLPCFTRGTDVTALAFSSDGERLAAASWVLQGKLATGVVQWWDTATWKQQPGELRGFKGRVTK